MSQQLHRFTCDCGAIVRVLPRHAGEERQCRCGRTIQIPTWREVQRLPVDADDSRAGVPTSGDTWSLTRGSLFAASLALLLVCLGVIAHAAYLTSWLQTQAPTVDDVLRYSTGPLAELDLATATPRQIWEVWKPLRTLELDQRPTPRYLASRHLARQLRSRMTVAAVLGSLGFLGVMGSLLVGRRRVA